MKIERAIELLSSLADGIDPTTGEIFDEESPYQKPDIIRALYVAISTLEKQKSRDNRLKRLPNNAGSPWSRNEDEQHISEFDNNTTISECSKIHQRTIGAIKSRLIKLGKISQDDNRKISQIGEI